MFSSSQSVADIAAQASDEIKTWERALSLRISLQKVMDASNKLSFMSEAIRGELDLTQLQSKSAEMVGETYNLLSMQLQPDKKSKKRKVHSEELEYDWEPICQLLEEFQPRWEEVINKWNSRLNFGSFDATSKMKTFKQSLWDQVKSTLADSNRIIEKSRLPLEDSNKLADECCNSSSFHSMSKSNEQSANTHHTVESIDGKMFDSEIYDDRQFYSMLLKTFISQNGSGTNNAFGGEDLAALRQFKKSKSNVDRKASKGRRIRYTVHPKLQSYMYPMPPPIIDANSDRIMQSLFQ